jgi:hypothetical protein
VSQPVGLKISPSIFFRRVANFFSAKFSELCTYTLAEKSEPGYGLLYCDEAIKSVQRALKLGISLFIVSIL